MPIAYQPHFTDLFTHLKMLLLKGCHLLQVTLNKTLRKWLFYGGWFYLVASRVCLEQFLDFTYSPRLEHEKWALSCQSFVTRWILLFSFVGNFWERWSWNTFFDYCSSIRFRSENSKWSALTANTHVIFRPFLRFIKLYWCLPCLTAHEGLKDNNTYIPDKEINWNEMTLLMALVPTSENFILLTSKVQID